MAQSERGRKQETRSGENSYKRSYVKPCFKTVILGTQNLINAAFVASKLQDCVEEVLVFQNISKPDNHPY